MSKPRNNQHERVVQRTPVAPASPSIITDEEVEDETFERELVDRYAGFVAGTPFVKTPDGT